MKNLNLGKKLTREQAKQIQGAGVLYFCGSTTTYFESYQDCVNYGQSWCFTGRFSCSTVGKEVE